MINLNFLKTIKPKFYLIAGLIFLIIILFLISSTGKKKLLPPSPSPKPSPAINPYASLPPLPAGIPNPDEQIRQERIDDPSIGQEIERTYTQKPWLKNLPITTKAYVIVYDWEKKAIRIRIIIDAQSPVSYEQQKEIAQKEAEKNLEQIGVDLSQEKFYYRYSP